ncbi:MAG: DUF4855 domain-containing protein [Bacteroidales bacterium]|nr:DUF4855 domain-containing protein [Bacteroidales bacterium]
MKTRRIAFCLPLFLLLAACGEKEPEPQPAHPAVRVTLQETSAFGVSLVFNTVEAVTVRYGWVAAPADPTLDQQLETDSTGPCRLELSLDGLKPGTEYKFAARGIGPGGEEGSLQELSFATGAGPGELYAWETARSTLPVPADLTLIPGHSSHRSPLAWDKERWGSHVSYVDEQGAEHWLFDGFLLIEGQQTGTYGTPGHTYVLTEASTPSATKELWQQAMDFWFTGGTFPWQESYWGNGVDTFGRWYTGRMVSPSPHFPTGQLDALEDCIRETAARIGTPPSKRYVVVSMPEPIYFENYIASVTANPVSGNTTYWGSLNGRAMDFSKVEDRVRACLWFIDEVRAAFARKHYEYIELLGFYILPETLDTQWRAEYKKYDVVLPDVAAYLHACNEGLYWIPYNLAPGYKTWQDFGIDIACMQPNYYWDETGKNPMDVTFREINRYGMGLELEFEYSMVEAVNGAASAAKYRARFDDYLRWARESGVYGTRPIALYSGTDALHQLANSTLPDDRTTYHKLCHFIIESPLKK